MTWWHAVIIFVAGIWAGGINAVVGSGTLVTFPVLVALGYPPVVATTSNAVGMAPGSISGAYGYRRELEGYWPQVMRFAVASFFGAICGTALLLTLPKDAFETVVPVLVGLAVVLVIVQPRISKWVQKRRTAAAAAAETSVAPADEAGPTPAAASSAATVAAGAVNASAPSGTSGAGRPAGPLLMGLLFLIGIYGGYFTAAQGVMMMAVMGMLLAEPMQRLNGVKNSLSAVVNVVAGLIYAIVAPVSWPVIGLLAVGSTIGGQLGAKIGRRLSPTVLRGVIVVIGIAAVVQLLLK
ncbi:sulfite exporter TauE/SafE family protein [Amycolatopsis sp. PS_44_ISF1]|uniref:sulfite exporter TauE/SafE family protein n=1 Tax=Amycolatopsis sp. PS_44_ISF1 TaxID=2974917 RepID=UPI0028DDF885|nr:sulfite exporter TauE/SafE family protein [Amycolatopsis sp. PS_44_ISF1]MDT8910214.1 sulfite exporter TauE/SafE family protein [Amycolatopsis sp. PS_44_ISF1]